MYRATPPHFDIFHLTRGGAVLVCCSRSKHTAISGAILAIWGRVLGALRIHRDGKHEVAWAIQRRYEWLKRTRKERAKGRLLTLNGRLLRANERGAERGETGRLDALSLLWGRAGPPLTAAEIIQDLRTGTLSELTTSAFPGTGVRLGPSPYRPLPSSWRIRFSSPRKVCGSP